MPEPIGTIELVAENQGLAPGGSADQTLPSAGAPTLTISIPVYDASKIGGDYSAFFQTVTPTNSSAFSQMLLGVVAGEINTVELPPGIFQINASLVSYSFTNPSTGGVMGVIVPATGIALQSPPKFSFTRDGSYFKDFPNLAMRINDGTAGYSSGKLMLPNGGGASQIVSYSLATFTPGGEAFTEDGIPVVVTDKDGKNVKVVSDAPESEIPLSMRLLQGLVGVIVIMGLLALFVMLPNGDSSMRSLGLVLVIFFLGLLPTILASSSLGGLRMLPSSGGYTGLIWLAMILSALILVAGIVSLGMEMFAPELNVYMIPSLGISILLIGAGLVFYVFTLANVTSSADYDSKFKTTPLFLQSLSSIFKTIIPLGLIAVMGLPLQILNPLYLQGLSSQEGFTSKTTAITTTETPKDITENINAMLRVVSSPETYMDDAYGSSLGKTIGAMRPIQPGEKMMSKIPKEIIAIQKGDSVVVPLLKNKASSGAGAGGSSGMGGGGGAGGKEVIGFHSLSTIRQNFPTKEGERPKSLGSGVDYMKITDFSKSMEDNVSFGYSLTLAVSLAVVMGVSLVAPSFVGSTAYPGAGEKEKPTPTFAEQLTDSLLGIVPPVVVAYFVHASGVYQTFQPGYWILMTTAVVSAGVNISMMSKRFTS
jgi:hypothetical protein